MHARWVVLALCLLVSAPIVRAQEEGQEPEPAGDEGAAEADPQARQADLEIAAQIFRAVSEECREEMQQSMTEQKELSEQCRGEIQEAIASGKVRIPQQQGGAPPPPPEEEAPVPLYANPILHVMVFLVAFFGAIGAYVFYVDGELSKVRPAEGKGKKKNKKKNKGSTWSIGDS